jgi:hypothetical protein
LKRNGDASRRGVESGVRPSNGRTAEEKWNALKENILSNARKHVGFKKGRCAKKPWVTEAMLQKMRERRKCEKATRKRGKLNIDS